jgi:hypothetical protein
VLKTEISCGLVPFKEIGLLSGVALLENRIRGIRGTQNSRRVNSGPGKMTYIHTRVPILSHTYTPWTRLLYLLSLKSR